MRFNPRPHARGDIMTFTVSRSGKMFQSTPPREGRPAYQLALSKYDMFQSTPPREGRHGGAKSVDHDSWFQSTPPREGRLRIQKVAEY